MYLNGKAKRYNISDATCARIEQIIKERGFVPNFHARAMASKQTLLIGVIISGGIDSSFWLNIISGIEEVIRLERYHMLLSVSHFDAGGEAESLRFMEQKGVDGYILSPVATADDQAANAAALRELAGRKPLVTITRQLDGVSGVFMDNFAGGEIAARSLLDAGHRRLACLGPDEPAFATRKAGFMTVVQRENIVPAQFTGVAELLAQYREFTGVFCCSDYLAMELYQEAAAAGVGIPDDLSVTGYDNMDFVRMTKPRLTTVHQYKQEIGQLAAQHLMALIGNANRERLTSPLLPFLVPGASIKLLA